MPALKRTLTPEILDSLSEGHPDALHNRRDLKLFNALMGNFGWLIRSIHKHTDPKSPILELGAGDGTFGKLMSRQLRAFGARNYSGLDLWGRPEGWPQNWAWLQEDITTTEAYASHPVVIGNMILHQFDSDMLAAIGRQLNAHAQVLIFNETARSKLSLALLPLTRLLGTNYVSNHDAKVSVESGFIGDELPQLLGLDSSRWTWQISKTFLGAYRFVAWRK